ncbi:MAG: hypothetical protein ABR956_13535 [Terracidiphilus sp.]
MSQSVRTPGVSRAILAARLVGFCIFVIAFFLPAVRQPAAAGASDTYKGAFCAWVTLVNSFSPALWHTKDFLAILSGWINPLMLLYLLLLIGRKLVWPRRIVASVIVLFMIATWIYFYLAPLVPLIGHLLWIVGALLMLAGEVAAPHREPGGGARG